MTRRPPVQAAKDFLKNHFPDCQGALLAGSVVRGEETSTSDLDIVIIDDTLSSAYRESFFVNDWPIEAFFHNQHTIRQYFQTDCERGETFPAKNGGRRDHYPRSPSHPDPQRRSR